MDPKTPMPIPGTYGGTEAWGTSVSVFWPQGKADSNWMVDGLVRRRPFPASAVSLDSSLRHCPQEQVSGPLAPCFSGHLH